MTRGLIALAPLAVALACGEPAESPQQPRLEDLNVVLIVVDTLGAEHVGCYAGLPPAASHSPNIDALAASGKRFDRAFSTAPWTQPSMASLFTGRMPSRHGVVRIGDRLSPHAETLAEALSNRGHRTHGVISHVLLNRNYGFAQGFDSYDQGPYEDAGDDVHAAITSERVTDAAIEWLEQTPDEPYFLFAHYFDPHFVYQHHADFEQGSSDYSGPVKPGMSIWELRDMRADLSADDLDYLRALYREEIAYTDHHIGRLLDAIRARGAAERTLILFTADHGEEFMRHGWIGHTRTLYDELVRIPLIAALPGSIEPGVSTDAASLIDVLPTLISLSDVPYRDAGVEGVSLAGPLFEGQPGEPSRRVFTEVSFVAQPGLHAEPGHPAPERDSSASDLESEAPNPEMEKTAFKSAILVDGLKLIEDHLTGTFELYNRANDPEELDNLWETPPPSAAALRDELRRWRARPSDGPKGSSERTSPTQSELDELKKLGYVHDDS